MNEYTFFEAAAKAEIGETLHNVSWSCEEICKRIHGFYWKDGNNTTVRMEGNFLKAKWIIIEEVERQKSEKKMKDFIENLTAEELKLLSMKIDVEFVERTKPK